MMRLRKTQLSAMLLIVFCFTFSTAFAQDKTKQKSPDKFCSNSAVSYDNKITVKEIRKMIIPASNLITVDAREHGSVSFKSSNRSDILIQACLVVTGNTEEEARAILNNIHIETDSIIKASNTPSVGWIVSYQIQTPRKTNVNVAGSRR